MAVLLLYLVIYSSKRQRHKMVKRTQKYEKLLSKFKVL